jgi:hypothetical protein
MDSERKLTGSEAGFETEERLGVGRQSDLLLESLGNFLDYFEPGQSLPENIIRSASQIEKIMDSRNKSISLTAHLPTQEDLDEFSRNWQGAKSYQTLRDGLNQPASYTDMGSKSQTFQMFIRLKALFKEFVGNLEWIKRHFE